MIEPAILYKNDIISKFNSLLYTDKYFWYNGGIDNYEYEIREEGDKFQFAITHQNQLIGFISFRIDWYCSCAFNFGLVKFVDSPSTIPIITNAIRKVIRMISGFNMHRIDFRCVSGNPAEEGYDRIISRFNNEYDISKFAFKDNIKDRHGNYHDTIVYELIHK